MFSNLFPKILQTILRYTNTKEEYAKQVSEINLKLLKIVIKIMKNKNDFKDIFNKLKKQFIKNNTVSNMIEILVFFNIDLNQRGDNNVVHRTVQSLPRRVV